MIGAPDARLTKNLGYVQDTMPLTKAIIESTKEQDRMDRVDKTMFSKGTIEKYTKTKDREYDEEEMEIG